jgi:hypothetical protein
MWVLLFAALLLLAAWWLLSLYALALVVLVYALSYLDGKEYTGERHWPQFRRLRLWRYLTPVKYLITNERDLSVVERRLYVAHGNTVDALVWGVGLHGGVLGEWSAGLRYVVPPPLMWVPVLRDILMWSGAVTWSAGRGPGLRAVLLDLLQSNRSVCYYPQPWALLDDPAVLPDELLQFAQQERLQLVPIAVHNEPLRYRFATAPWLRTLQRWSLRHMEYPAPWVYWPRWCGPKRPPRLELQFGAVISASRFETAAKLREVLEENMKSLQP